MGWTTESSKLRQKNDDVISLEWWCDLESSNSDNKIYYAYHPYKLHDSVQWGGMVHTIEDVSLMTSG